MKQTAFPRFHRVVNELIDGLQSGSIVVETEGFAESALRILAETMQAGLPDLQRLVMKSDLSGAALCSCLWDSLLENAQQAIERQWPRGECCLSYWLVQSERMVGHYAPQVRDREHIGHQYFNLLSIDESPCGQSLKTKKPLFFSEFHEAAKCVGSLATWPVLDSGGDRGLAVLMLEARTQGFIQHHPDTSLFLSNLAQCFGLLSVFIMARGFDRADPQSPVATTVPVNSMAVPSNNLTNAK